MPVPEEFVKKRTEVTISRASLKVLECQKCGAHMDTAHIQGGFAKCSYCGHVYSLQVEGHTGV
jgi:uncharacterized Zn-finger protein